MFTIQQEIFKRLNSRSKWLALWAVYKEPGLTGRQIAVKMGLSWAATKNALESLHEENFLHRKEGPKSFRYYPNKNHVLASFLKSVFNILESAGKFLFKELDSFLSQRNAKLVSLKISSKKFYLVIAASKNSKDLFEKILSSKKLPGIDYEIVFLSETDRLKEIASSEGEEIGLSLETLLEAVQKEKKLAFFSF